MEDYNFYEKKTLDYHVNTFINFASESILLRKNSYRAIFQRDCCKFNFNIRGSPNNAGELLGNKTFLSK